MPSERKPSGASSGDKRDNKDADSGPGRGDAVERGSKRDKRRAVGKEAKEGVDPNDREQLEALGRRIRQLRVQRGYKSQLAFVLQAGLPRGSYSDTERGRRNLTISTLLGIARALNVELADLFSEAREGVAPTSATGAQASVIAHTPSFHEQSAGQGATEPPTDSIEPVEAFPFREAQDRFRAMHPRLVEPPVPPMVPLAGQESASLEPGVAQTGGDAGALKRRRHKDRGGTLVSTAVAATAFGVNIRTVERWVESGKLQPSNWLDGRVAVFHREEIEALAKEYREYVALREQISSAVGAGDANVRIEASKALKRLLKRYKRKRKTRSGE